MRNTFYSLYFKRFIDFILSLISIVILSPLFIFIIFLQSILNGFPIFFVQPRVGKNERIFNLIKFRTMTNTKDLNNQFLPDFKRLTWFGKFLRKFSLDELPSIINVLKGDMSIIGPRPLLIEYLQYYNNDQRKRHLVRPGISGLAQIKGRNKISWDEKFNFDLMYIKSISFILDFKIIIYTFYFVIFKTDTVNSSNEVTFEKFKGKK